MRLSTVPGLGRSGKMIEGSTSSEESGLWGGDAIAAALGGDVGTDPNPEGGGSGEGPLDDPAAEDVAPL